MRDKPRRLFEDVRGILFDFDGTLAHLNIDFPVMTREIHELMGRWGLDYRRLTELYVLEKIHEASNHMGARWEDFRQEAMVVLLQIEMQAAMKGRLLPGVRSLLRHIRESGIKVGVLTRNCRKAVLTVAPDLERHCDVFVPRDDIVHVKPHPAHLEMCLTRLGIDSRESVMVGDHIIDIRSGQSLGMRTVGVLTGNTPRRALEEAGADLVLDEVCCLAPFLGIAWAH